MNFENDALGNDVELQQLTAKVTSSLAGQGTPDAVNSWMAFQFVGQSGDLASASPLSVVWEPFQGN